jgi:catechol 2,3-dioxygenase
LYEDRSALAAAFYVAGTATQGTFTGSADHLVSEAFYFDDPEGNGVELYWDRPRDQWRWTDGSVVMDTLPLDPNAFIAQHHAGGKTPTAPLGAATTIGHVHLKVGDIATARDFYVTALGFDVTTAMGSSALFTSAGGYHHHVGMNVWESRGAGQRTPALGLERFTVIVPDADALAATAARLTAAGRTFESTAGQGGIVVTDPWGTTVEVNTSA